MRMRGTWLIGLAILLLAGAMGTGAQKKPKETSAETKTVGERVRDVLPESEIVFSEYERTVVKEWFTTHRAGLPPGLAKKEHLPPGLEKQLKVRGTLPPGLQKKLHPLPLELEHKLRRIPTGYRRVVIAGNVILMNEKTAIIYDIIRNAIP